MRGQEQPITGLIMGGGGARGAYAAGLVFGIVEVLGLGPDEPSPFKIFSGTSAGSVNCGWFAAYGDQGDLGGEFTRNQWLDMTLESHIKLRPLNLLSDRSEDAGRSLLDPAPFERTIAEILPWDRARKNIREGKIRGVMLTALELSSGRSVWFTHMSPGCDVSDWSDERRAFIPVDISGQHALASSAIPLVFPPRKVGNHFYCDGGVRHKTPISSAIRAGAERLVVISLRNEEETALSIADDVAGPTPVEMLGKVVGSLSYDSARYDLDRLEAINELVDVMDDVLEPTQQEKIQQALVQKRGAPWRKIPTLSFKPTHDFGAIAVEHARLLAKKATRSNRVLMRVLENAGRTGALSFILFDRSFTGAMLDLGRQDAFSRADDIRAFFSEYQ
jgi:NTE family protein